MIINIYYFNSQIKDTKTLKINNKKYEINNKTKNKK